MLAFSCGLEKAIQIRWVWTHILILFFFFWKHGDKFLCFQKNPDTVWTGPKTQKKRHKNAFYVWTEGRNVEKKYYIRIRVDKASQVLKHKSQTPLAYK